MTDPVDCPACGNSFTPKRTNQSLCSRSCQKNATRGDRFLENQARNELQMMRAWDLRVMLYSAPPNERLGVMKDVLDAAEHDGSLRNILTWPVLLADRMGTAGRGQSNIAKAADAYTKKFFGVSITTYIRGVRTGTKPLPVEVGQSRYDGPVPRLKTRLHSGNVKCIHKPLPEVAPNVTNADFDSVERLVAATQARIPHVPTKPQAADSDAEITSGSSKQDARRKLALSAMCFARDIEITGKQGRSIAAKMGIRSLQSHPLEFDLIRGISMG